jgi:hypothetical protein
MNLEMGGVRLFVCLSVSVKKLLNRFRQNKYIAMISLSTTRPVLDHSNAKIWGSNPAVFYVVALRKKKRSVRFADFVVSQTSHYSSAYQTALSEPIATKVAQAATLLTCR